MLTTIIDLAEDRRSRLLEEATEGHLARSAVGARRDEWQRTAGTRRAGSLRPLAVAVSGLVVLGLAAGALLVTLPLDKTSPGRRLPAVAQIEKLAQVTTADLVYEPGHSSGWHVHPGVHAVVVLTGTLTVYDEGCGRHDFGPGDTYVGGLDPHVARNEHVEPVRMVVTYVADGAAQAPGSPVPAPSGCEAVA